MLLSTSRELCRRPLLSRCSCQIDACCWAKNIAAKIHIILVPQEAPRPQVVLDPLLLVFGIADLACGAIRSSSPSFGRTLLIHIAPRLRAVCVFFVCVEGLSLPARQRSAPPKKNTDPALAVFLVFISDPKEKNKGNKLTLYGDLCFFPWSQK
jgi:hypothetical protein